MLAFPLFALLATANGAGYRYGASDQLFYIPVVMRALDPAMFPRDGALIDAQGHLMLADEAIGALARASGLSIEWLFLGAYLASLALVWAGLLLIGRRVYASPWITVALATAFTLRHRITRTSANSFEPYFHPRVVAFGVGLIALAAVLHRRAWLAAALVGTAILVHVTTGLWFGVMVGVALVVLEPSWRRVAVPAGVVAAVAAGWALAAGPLRGRLVTMDEVWLEAVASKDSLFPTAWPVSAWAANLGLLAVLWWAHRRRVATGRARAEDGALVWGATALVAVFLATLPAVAAGVAIAVQLQISRVFWLVDALALVYLLAALAESTWVARVGPRAVAATLAALAIARGVYVMEVENPERPIVAVHLLPSPWQDAMAWLAAQPKDVHVLADPGHAWKYGSSVRVAAGRDVLQEETKDSAVAIYSRDVAVRVVERMHAIEDFPSMTAATAVRLADRYGLHYMVTEQRLALPLAYENERFRIYRLAAGP